MLFVDPTGIGIGFYGNWKLESVRMGHYPGGLIAVFFMRDFNYFWYAMIWGVVGETGLFIFIHLVG